MHTGYEMVDSKQGADVVLNFLQSSDIRNDCFPATEHEILVDIISFNLFKETGILV